MSLLPEAIEDSPVFLIRDLKTELNRLLLAFETTMFESSSEIVKKKRMWKFYKTLTKPQLGFSANLDKTSTGFFSKQFKP